MPIWSMRWYSFFMWRSCQLLLVVRQLCWISYFLASAMWSSILQRYLGMVLVFDNLWFFLLEWHWFSTRWLNWYMFLLSKEDYWLVFINKLIHFRCSNWLGTLHCSKCLTSITRDQYASLICSMLRWSFKRVMKCGVLSFGCAVNPHFINALPFFCWLLKYSR